jgi:bacillopeptidase F
MMSETDYISAIVMMKEHVDIPSLNRELDGMRATRAHRHESVVRTLQEKAGETQRGLVRFLDSKIAGGEVFEYKTFWIANLVMVEARKSVIEKIAERPDVGDIYYNYEIEGIDPVAMGDAPEDVIASIEEGLERINAPEAWARGFTGEGRIVSHLDTGVDGNHPALAARWRGLREPPEECWFDPVTFTNFPQDFSTHGTHTMGTICGYEVATDDHIGVAYKAEWISAAVIDRVSIPVTMADAIEAWEWTADPDGDPTTVDDVPDVSSNSWRISPIFHGGYLEGACDQYFWDALDGCEAAGVVVVQAAGNEGNSPPNSVGNPSNRAVDPFKSFSVGAIDGSNYGNDPVAGFSSRGPVPEECGPYTTKPEVTAPGDWVRSSMPGGGYGYMSGTSMSTPHVAGAVAILRQADPNASSEQIKFALMSTAQDLGPTGEDNTYGWGLIDLNAALDVILASGCTWEMDCSPNNPPIIIPEEGGSFSFDGSITNVCDFTRLTDIWSMVRLPSGDLFGPVIWYNNLSFGENQIRSVTGMTHEVPARAPAGTYQYIVYYGDYPSAPEDSCFFSFEKEGVGHESLKGEKIPSFGDWSDNGFFHLTGWIDNEWAAKVQ